MRISRARLVLGTTAVLGLVGVVGVGVPTVSAVVDGAPGYRSVRTLAGDAHRLCGEVAFQEASGSVACAHQDVPPPGVDVTKPVSTAVLETREGGRDRAVRAAQQEGVAVPATVAAAGDRVQCDGDGTSGYRTQAMYVTSADRPNRFGALQDQIKLWAAGVDTVFNLSAAKTGGVRNVRYVTDAATGGTCTAKVLNVTVPAGSFSSFGATISAMRALGYDSPTRKYLMWVDGTGQCGIAQTYLDSRADQGNANNGSYTQFARIDTACWGGASSVEAHELAHTLGSVQNDAPHSTKVGHCWDESDRMCYADGGAYAMKQVCAGDQEPLLDCNDDDYYSTYPPAGSYLATHWNTASSRFLIGGGDGNGGGTLGVPTRLGGTVSVNNPAVPGVATQLQASLEVPAGRTTTTTWSSTRRDCVFADRSAEQTTVTCDAGLTAAAPVTLTVTDSAGERITRSTSVTFDRTARPAEVSAAMDGGTDGSYVLCPTGRGVLSAIVRDQSSGASVKGVTVSWYRTTGSLAPVRVATAVSDAGGRAAPTAVVLAAGSYRATTTGTGAFGTVSSAPTVVTSAPAACPTTVTAELSDGEVMAGEPVTVAGRLTRTLPDGSVAPAPAETVSVERQAAAGGPWARIATATTGPDGGYSTVVRPTTGGTIRVALPARAAYLAGVSAPLPLAVSTWQTAATVTLSDADVMAATPVVVSGALSQSDGSTSGPLAGQRVQLTYPVAGGRTAVTSAVTRADGTFTATVSPTGSGTVTARYAGMVGWGAATATADLQVTTWRTSLSAAASPDDVMATSPVAVTGVLRQQDADGVESPLRSRVVSVSYPVAGGRTASTTGVTRTDGTYAVTVRPTAAGTVTASYAGTVGWEPATRSVPLTVTSWQTAVTSGVSATSVAALTPVTVSGTVTRSGAGSTTPFATATVTVTYPTTAGRVSAVTTRTTSTGTYSVAVRPASSGEVVVRVVPPAGFEASVASPVALTVG
jgi:hypothetical protein